CQFHKNSLSERLLEGKSVTLRDEFTEHKVVAQKASFPFLTEDISLFTIALYGLPNSTLQIPQLQS
ncbi:nef attachable domain protein, partial [Chlamydia psittaci C1/97]